MAKTAWHPAFCCALEIELEDYADYLEFLPEYELSKEPLRLDMLVIRKQANIHIKKKLGRLFKGHNIVEYKSPTDYISIDDYHKVLGYAHFYKAITGTTDAINIADMTITLACNRKPKKLWAYLIEKRQFTITETWQGIYYIVGDTFSTQILIRSELSEDENFYLKCLSDNLEKETLIKALTVREMHRKESKYTEYFTTIWDANLESLLEVEDMIKKTPELMQKLEKFAYATGMAEEMEARGEARGKARGKLENQLQIAQSLLDVLDDATIVQTTELPLATVQKLRKQQEQEKQLVH